MLYMRPHPCYVEGLDLNAFRTHRRVGQPNTTVLEQEHVFVFFGKKKDRSPINNFKAMDALELSAFK